MTDTVPPEELNKRRRYAQLTDELDTLMRSVAGNLNEMQDLGADPTVIRDEIVRRLESIQIGPDGSLDTLDEPPGGGGIVPPMVAMIARVLEEAPKLTNPDGSVDTTQRPAAECHVILRGTQQPMKGSLSTSRDGGLRMMWPANVDGKHVLVETFFEYDDVLAVMVEREVKGVGVASPRIVTASS